jgi:hypothetical protein
MAFDPRGRGRTLRAFDPYQIARESEVSDEPPGAMGPAPEEAGTAVLGPSGVEGHVFNDRRMEGRRDVGVDTGSAPFSGGASFIGSTLAGETEAL